MTPIWEMARGAILVSLGVALLRVTATGAEAELARRVLEVADVPGGLVVHIGGGDPAAWGRLTAGLGAHSRYVVHGLYGGPGPIEAARAAIRATGCYGRVSAELWRGNGLPYCSNLVNLIVLSGGPIDVAREEIARVLAPGGVAVAVDPRRTRFDRFRQPRPETIDDWTHLLYDATGNAVSADRRVGPPHHLQWIAGPLNARHHEKLGTVSVVVSAGGKLFYVIDEGPTASILLPPRWALVARDAFSGVVLWRREIPRWEDHLRPFRSGPPQLGRTLVATGDRVYATLGLRAPVSALDPATGKTLQAYPETQGTEEILVHEGVLYLATREADEGTAPGAMARRGVMAVGARTGRVLWEARDAHCLPMSLAVGEGRVVWMTTDAVVCRDAATGQVMWSTPREVAEKRPGWSAPTVVVQDGVVLAADRWPAFKDTIDEVTGKPIARWLAEEGWTGDLIAYDADSGRVLWQCPCAEAYHAPPDVFVIDGLVFVGQSRSRTGPDFVAARDLHTGQIRRRLDTSQAWQTTMPHHRCHRNRATTRYIVAGRTGVEFIDVMTGESARHHWTRGTCQFGTLPANGLLYVPPHACACYIEGKLTGLLALAPKSPEPAGARSAAAFGRPEDAARLERGPAYADGASPSSPPGDPGPSDWPTYRHDAARSGATAQAVPQDLGHLWQRRLGGRLTPPVVSGGRVFVASVDEHTLHAVDALTGEPLWSFTAAGRIDSPPTAAQGRVLFGSADGSVYCLRSRDGTLAWRFRAAPADRRVMAFGQLESAWPVHGSVLTRGDDVYFVAGRSAFLDGGMTLYRLRLVSGEVLAARRIYLRDPETGRQPAEPAMFEMPGALPDVLSTDGQRIYMRHLAFDPQTLEPCEPEDHLFSPAGFLNGDWSHRTYWIVGRHFYSGYIGWYFAGRETPAGRLLALDAERIYGYGYRPEFYRGATGRKYHVFAVDRRVQPPQPPADYRRASRDYPARGPGKFRVPLAWSQDVPLVVRAMALARDQLLLAGLPAGALEAEPPFRGEDGGRLAVAGTADGRTHRLYRLASLPVYDGLAVAGQHVYLSTQDGRLHGLAGTDQPGTTPLETVGRNQQRAGQER